MSTLILVLSIHIVLVGGGLACIAFYKQANEICALMIARWLKRDGLELVSSERVSILNSPFPFPVLRGPRDYRIVVKDLEGKERYGWARCGTAMGLYGDRVIFIWDKPKA